MRKILWGGLLALPIVGVATGLAFRMTGVPAHSESSNDIAGVNIESSIDDSGSERELGANQATRVGRSIMRSASLVRHLKPSVDRLTISAVSNSSSEIYGPTIPHSATNFQKALVGLLKPTEVRPELSRGTLPAHYFEEAIRRTTISTLPSVIIYQSNGDIDDGAEQAFRRGGNSPQMLRLRKVAQTLKANPRVEAVLIVGVQRGRRELWDSLFAPLGNRFSLCGDDDFSLDFLLRPIETARLHNLPATGGVQNDTNSK